MKLLAWVWCLPLVSVDVNKFVIFHYWQLRFSVLLTKNCAIMQKNETSYKCRKLGDFGWLWVTKGYWNVMIWRVQMTSCTCTFLLVYCRQDLVSFFVKGRWLKPTSLAFVAGWLHSNFTKFGIRKLKSLGVCVILTLAVLTQYSCVVTWMDRWSHHKQHIPRQHNVVQ